MVFSGASNVITEFHITVPTGVNTQIGAIDSFAYISNTGTIKNLPTDSSAQKAVTYQENNESYQLSFGMIPIKKGIYYFILLDIYQAQKKCTYASIQITRANLDGHLHYLQDIYYNGGPVDPVSQARAFCFKVY